MATLDWLHHRGRGDCCGASRPCGKPDASGLKGDDNPAAVKHAATSGAGVGLDEWTSGRDTSVGDHGGTRLARCCACLMRSGHVQMGRHSLKGSCWPKVEERRKQILTMALTNKAILLILFAKNRLNSGDLAFLDGKQGGEYAPASGEEHLPVL